MNALALPNDRIVVSGGKVTKYQRWTNWNGIPWVTLDIVRTKNEKGFLLSLGDPEHGGGALEGGTIDSVLRVLHPQVSAAYRELFKLEDATEEKIRRLGFDRRVDIDLQ